MNAHGTSAQLFTNETRTDVCHLVTLSAVGWMLPLSNIDNQQPNPTSKEIHVSYMYVRNVSNQSDRQ
jgi:hypothetical protein